MYDKKASRFSDEPIPIRKVAQSSGFYTEDQERQLNRLIEIPGNRAIEKLVNGRERTGGSDPKAVGWPGFPEMAEEMSGRKPTFCCS